jgi:hypothetical protein
MQGFRSRKFLNGGMFVGPDDGGMSSSALWYLLALISCLFIVVLNGGILFYFDTSSYLGWGTSLLGHLIETSGSLPNDAPPAIEGLSSAAIETKSTAANTVKSPSFSRSRIFSLVVGLFAHLKMLEAVAVPQCLYRCGSRYTAGAGVRQKFFSRITRGTNSRGLSACGIAWVTSILCRVPHAGHFCASAVDNDRHFDRFRSKDELAGNCIRFCVGGILDFDPRLAHCDHDYHDTRYRVAVFAD